jgi:hypothetical protein
MNLFDFPIIFGELRISALNQINKVNDIINDLKPNIIKLYNPIEKDIIQKINYYKKYHTI